MLPGGWRLWLQRSRSSRDHAYQNKHSPLLVENSYGDTAQAMESAIILLVAILLARLHHRPTNLVHTERYLTIHHAPSHSPENFRIQIHIYGALAEPSDRLCDLACLQSSTMTRLSPGCLATGTMRKRIAARASRTVRVK